MSIPNYSLPNATSASLDPEHYRPLYHYTTSKDWMSDPNGMVFYDGEFHLCYQHDRYDHVFGSMSWGHAISTNLLDWKELPRVVEPDSQLGMCFSGCMVVDKNNSAGFGKNALVGLYTSELPKQQQSLFYSIDKGRTFSKYKHNPVIENAEGQSPDFRDPKVFWHEETAQWIMALAGPERIEFWSSPNLLDWQLESWFGENIGAHGGEWECPDLRRFYVDDDPNQQVWVLVVSVNPGGPNGGCGTQYFLGSFEQRDGKMMFVTTQTEIKWLDWGTDNYAGVGWTNLEDSSFAGRVLSIGWMNNWIYAYKTPTSEWRGVMTMIRELKLETFDDDLVLTCRPAHIYDQLVGQELCQSSNIKLNRVTKIGSGLSASRLRIRFACKGASEVGIELSNSLGDVTRIGYERNENIFYIDRTKSGDVDFAEGFKGKHSAIAKKTYEYFELEVFIDRCSIEVFINNAEYAMTELIFPVEPLSSIKPFAEGNASISSFDVREIGAIKKHCD